MKRDEKFKILVLSDVRSWINPTVELLISHWEESGHEIFWAHEIKDAPVADFCFCLSFSKILPKEIRNHFRHTLVVHASDLPSGKWWSPLTWQILEGKDRIPVTLFEAQDSIDSGPIYAQRTISFEGYELIDPLREKLANLGLDEIKSFI